MGLASREKELRHKYPALVFGREGVLGGQVRAVWIAVDPWFGESASARESTFLQGLVALRRRWAALPEPTLVLGNEPQDLWRDELDADLLALPGIEYLVFDAPNTEFKRVIDQLCHVALGCLSEAQTKRNRNDFWMDLTTAKHLIDNFSLRMESTRDRLLRSTPDKAERHLADLARNSKHQLEDKIRANKVLDMSIFKEAHLGVITELGMSEEIDAMHERLLAADRAWQNVHNELCGTRRTKEIAATVSKYVELLRQFSELARGVKKIVSA